jgi:hypothetical protein
VDRMVRRRNLGDPPSHSEPEVKQLAMLSRNDRTAAAGPCYERLSGTICVPEHDIEATNPGISAEHGFRIGVTVRRQPVDRLSEAPRRRRCVKGPGAHQVRLQRMVSNRFNTAEGMEIAADSYADDPRPLNSLGSTGPESWRGFKPSGTAGTGLGPDFATLRGAD